MQTDPLPTTIEVVLMERLGAFSDSDGLSQLLLRLTVNSTLYCLSAMTAPWGFKVAARSGPAFHLLTSGSAWLEVEGRREPVRVAAGDLVILPRGEAHVMRDSMNSQVQWLDRILAQTPPINGRLNHGGGGEPSELLCGGFVVEQLTARPLIEALPTIVHLRGSGGHAPEWLAGLVRMISVEMASSGPGSEAVVTRLTDALLAQSLRQSIVEADRVSSSSTAVSDPHIARALRLIREQPDRPWTVPKMAAAVSMSRSTFADRFQAATGETPMQHLTRYRMARAAEYLRGTNAGVREIARLVGYDSEVSVTKAFRRQFGTSPGAYRKSTGRQSDPVAAHESQPA
jgi:AraC family transcriptional regulator, alkane utilization regulator